MGSTIEFNFEELEDLTDRVQSADTVARISLNDGMRALGRLFVPAKGTGPLANATPKVTGKLARSTFFQIIGGPKEQILKILQPARTPDGEFYGEFVRDGTRPHDIRPKNAKALRFMIGSNVIFAMVVKHPGNRPNPYHKRTLAALRPRVGQIVKRMATNITAHIAGR